MTIHAWHNSSYVLHDSVICVTPPYVCGALDSYTCDTTHSWVTWRIQVCKMNHLYVTYLQLQPCQRNAAVCVHQTLICLVCSYVIWIYLSCKRFTSGSWRLYAWTGWNIFLYILVCSWNIQVWTGTGLCWGLSARVMSTGNSGETEFIWTPSVHSSGIFKWRPYT